MELSLPWNRPANNPPSQKNLTKNADFARIQNPHPRSATTPKITSNVLPKLIDMTGTVSYSVSVRGIQTFARAAPRPNKARPVR